MRAVQRGHAGRWLWLGLDVGTDIPLAHAAGRAIIHAGLRNRAFVERATTGFEEYPELVEPWTLKPDRFGPDAARLNEAPRIDNDLYVRDSDKCILCCKCVDACGEQWQNTFAVSVVGRGFDARIAVEQDAPLTDPACVYCGNCIEVCPTGALGFRTEFAMRAAGTWDESRQTETTVCACRGVGCDLTLHVQDNEIVKVTSPHDSPVTHGNLCIKGRFGYQHVQNLRKRD
ncbi:Fe-S-binding domain-containing protein [Streptomyces sp. CB03238]|nr:Fe-S-binding domain-containing protein [Streptomyces sp. CB03238]